MAKWAVVTGASGGLGEALARNIAARGYNVVLVARSEAAMQSLALELRQAHGVEVAVEMIDLSVANSAANLEDRLATAGIEADVLINNAAFGMNGPFLKSDPTRLRDMLQLDIVTLTELTLLIGRQMLTRGSGKILLVGSVASSGPSPFLAAYAAAKAYVWSLGEALHVEMAPMVGVTVLTPGIMDTGFNAVSGFRTSDGLRRTMLSTSKVAQIGLDALFAGKPSVIAGRINLLLVFSARFFSRNFAAKTAYRMGQAAVQRGGD